MSAASGGGQTGARSLGRGLSPRGSGVPATLVVQGTVFVTSVLRPFLISSKTHVVGKFPRSLGGKQRQHSGGGGKLLIPRSPQLQL